jgi:lipopolysaccharide assembly outer membrane protein LptD (OstA)
MSKRNITKVFLIIFFFIVMALIYDKLLRKKQTSQLDSIQENQILYNSNIIQDVNYTSKDAKGNEYIINATKGEIDYSNSGVIFLTDVRALIKLKDSNNVNITSNFGKYNINNYDTIFSKNVIITYVENKINSEYLDFSISRNSMIISDNVVYTDNENIIRADVAEVNLETKDTKIFMYHINKKVNIKSKNYNGNN